MQLSILNTPWIQSVLSQAGRPFIERSLVSRSHAVKTFIFGSVFTGVLGGLNLFYLGYLESLKAWRIGFSDQEFLRHGLESVAGTFSLQLSVLLAIALFLIAPTLACQTVLKENESRTIDSLFLTPLSPYQLHNGFVFGSLARVFNFAAPSFLVLVALGVLTPWIDFSTVLFAAPLLLIGAWGMTSLGAMFGVLLMSFARGPLASLVMFALFASVLGLPLLSFESTQDLPFASLSPASALVYAFVTDSNYWLMQFGAFESMDLSIFRSMQSPFLGLPIQPSVLSMMLMGGLGALTTHVSVRKIDDPDRAATSFSVAMASLVFVSFFISLLIASEARQYDTTSWQIARRGMSIWALGVFFTLPLFNLFVAGILPTKRYNDRVRLWSLTRPSAAATMRDYEDAPRKALALAVVVPLVAFLPVFFNLKSDFTVESLASHARIITLAPLFLWCYFTPYLIHRLWQTSDRSAAQAVGTLLGIGASTIAGAVYCVICIDERSLSLNDISWGGGSFGDLLGLSFIFALCIVPVILWLWLKGREEDLSMHTEGRLAMCAEKPVQHAQPSAWPSPKIPEHRVDILLRPSINSQSSEAHPSTWLALEDNTLLFWEGGEPGRSAHDGAACVDLSKPFVLDASLHPNMEGTQTLSAVHMTVIQNDPTNPTHTPERISFALPVHRAEFAGQLPEQVKHFATVGPRDAHKVLSFIRYYAEANGIRLPW